MSWAYRPVVPIGKYEVPGFRANLWGKLTVNLGVFVHEMYEAV
jgi:hypothetical protein